MSDRRHLITPILPTRRQTTTAIFWVFFTVAIFTLALLADRNLL